MLLHKHGAILVGPVTLFPTGDPETAPVREEFRMG
jgi:hypothetical protein